MICPKPKSAIHCLTKLFPIYQNKPWTIRRRDDCSVDPSFHRTILNIAGFLNRKKNPQEQPKKFPVYTRHQNVWSGWPVCDVKWLCSRGHEWRMEGCHSHQLFNIWFLWHEVLFYEMKLKTSKFKVLAFWDQCRYISWWNSNHKLFIS